MDRARRGSGCAQAAAIPRAHLRLADRFRPSADSTSPRRLNACRCNCRQGTRVVCDADERPHIRQRAPQPMAGSNMRRVKRARLAEKEALRKLMHVTQVEVTDLRTLDTDDAEDVACRHGECAPVEQWEDS